MLYRRRSFPCWGALGWLALAACSTDAPSNDGGAGGPGGAAAGAAGAAGTVGGGGGTSGGRSGEAGPDTGGAAGGSGSGGGGSAGSSGSQDAGASGSSGGGRAGAAGGGVADAAMDRADGDDAFAPDQRAADSSADTAAGDADARADVGAPPSDAPAECTPFPSAGVYATFRVVGEVFYVSMTNPTGIDQALLLWRGQSQARIPVGQLECGNGTNNCGWTWRMNPASVTFAEITIEVCSALPSYVENNCASFPNAQYCPSSAELIALRDCRTDVSCPAVPR